MADRITISEIQLYNYTAREYMNTSRSLLDTEGFHLILEVKADDLVTASENEKIRGILKNADQLVIADTGILAASGLMNAELEQEIIHMTFCMELMNLLEKSQKRVLVVGLTEEDTGSTVELLSFEFPKLQVSGFPVSAALGQSADAVVNEINSAGADMLMSVLPLEEEMKFLMEYKGRISARIWYGIPADRFESSKPGLAGQLKKGILQRILKSRLDVEQTPL